MPVVAVFELPGVTEQQYLEAFRLVPEVNEGDQEEGHLVHIGAPYEHGWRIVDVWESEAAFAAFAEQADLAGCWAQVGVSFPEARFHPVRLLER